VLITRLFDEELDRLLAELPATASSEDKQRLQRARQLSEGMILNDEINPV
jgi:hypothetical protein